MKTKSTTKLLWVLAAVSLVVLLSYVGCRQKVPRAVSQVIQATVQPEAFPASIEKEKERVRAWEKMCSFYRDREFQPAWLTVRNVRPQVQELLKAIEASAAEGLDPRIYQREHLERLLQEIENTESHDEPASQRRLAYTDMHLTFTFLTLAAHMATGRIRPGSPRPEWDVKPRDVDLEAPLQEALENEGNLEGALRSLRPPGDGYKQLIEALARYRKIAAQGGWREIAPAEKLVPGSRTESVGRLKARLRAEGDLPALQDGETEEEIFDEAVTAAVARFQKRYGLEITGKVDKDTLAAMDIPAAERARQIEMNLERWRWMPADFGERYIRVNIPELEMVLIDHGEPVLAMRVVVGEPPQNRTKIFSATMTYLVLNPSWIIPQTIAQKEILPKVENDPAYLNERNIQVVKKESKTILIQSSGPDNPLGQYKFMFQNKHDIYLHDTPDEHQFARAERALSHGCIRLERPEDLAHVLLQGSEWTPERLRKVLASGREKNIRLPHSLPVHLLYFTAWVDKDGTVQFRRDIYGHDPRLEKALAEEPMVELDLKAEVGRRPSTAAALPTPARTPPAVARPVERSTAARWRS